MPADGMDTEADEEVCFVVGTVVLAVNHLPPSAIASLADLGEQEVMDLLPTVDPPGYQGRNGC
jgi:hypothetical protein